MGYFFAMAYPSNWWNDSCIEQPRGMQVTFTKLKFWYYLLTSFLPHIFRCPPGMNVVWRRINCCCSWTLYSSMQNLDAIDINIQGDTKNGHHQKSNNFQNFV